MPHLELKLAYWWESNSWQSLSQPIRALGDSSSSQDNTIDVSIIRSENYKAPNTPLYVGLWRKYGCIPSPSSVDLCTNSEIVAPPAGNRVSTNSVPVPRGRSSREHSKCQLRDRYQQKPNGRRAFKAVWQLEQTEGSKPAGVVYRKG